MRTPSRRASPTRGWSRSPRPATCSRWRKRRRWWRRSRRWGDPQSADERNSLDLRLRGLQAALADVARGRGAAAFRRGAAEVVALPGFLQRRRIALGELAVELAARARPGLVLGLQLRLGVERADHRGDRVEPAVLDGIDEAEGLVLLEAHPARRREQPVQ